MLFEMFSVQDLKNYALYINDLYKERIKCQIMKTKFEALQLLL